MVLSLNALQLAHPGQSPLFRGVSLQVAGGEMLCILGPNGTGKTTLLRSLLGLHRPSQGTVQIDGDDVWPMPARQLARHVAYVPQAAGPMPPFTVADMVLMGRTPHLSPLTSPTAADHRCAQAAMQRIGITRLQHQRYTEISGGERQLTLIARAVAQQAQILVLDEPTASLDYGNQVRILRVLRDLAGAGRTVVMASHFPDHALLTSCRVAILAQEQLLADGPAAAVLSEALLSRVYGVPVRLIELAPGVVTAAAVSVCVPVLDVNT